MKITINTALRTMAVCFSLMLWLAGVATAQRNCELRNNPKTKTVEIYIDVTIERYVVDTTVRLPFDKNDYIVWRQNRMKQWYNLDSLSDANNGRLEYENGVIYLKEIADEHKRFRIYMEEWLATSR
jgi:hypothetical protein